MGFWVSRRGRFFFPRPVPVGMANALFVEVPPVRDLCRKERRELECVTFEWNGRKMISYAVDLSHKTASRGFFVPTQKNVL